VLPLEKLPEFSKVFNALGNETRLRILIMAAESERPLHIKAYAKALKKRYSAVYRHVSILRRAGLVTVYEVGRSRVVVPKKGLNLEALFNALYSGEIITK